MKSFFYLLLPILILEACSGSGEIPDASGTFEADEVVVSAELSGKLLHFAVEEGQLLGKDSIIGQIDPLPLALQKEQVEASIASLQEKTLDPGPQLKLLTDQLAVQQSQLSSLQREKLRVENLIRADAATRKQLDDILSQIDVLEKQMIVTRQQVQVQQTAIATQNRSILSERNPLTKRASQLDDQLNRSRITNPVKGTVLTKYAQEGEVTGAGKALYKIADLSVLTLRAYVTGPQLSQLKLGQTMTVQVDDGKDKYRTYTGTLTWIADHAEFTPKTIQTKEERANLVYAIKIKVKNDGLLKIGMYGEVKL
jgi:HlyD family secretion protein